MAKVCPECGHVFQGNGWDGTDADWKAEHEEIMPYKAAWPLPRDGGDTTERWFPAMTKLNPSAAELALRMGKLERRMDGLESVLREISAKLDSWTTSTGNRSSFAAT